MLEERTYEPSTAYDWRPPPAAMNERGTRFYLHEFDNACGDSRKTRHAFRKLLGGRPMQEVLPIAMSQYVPDTHLMDAFEQHPCRTHNPAHADWHVISAVPATSDALGGLGLLGGPAGHQQRMQDLGKCLLANRHWAQRGVRFLLHVPSLDLEMTVGRDVMQAVMRRDLRVGPVVLGVFDRSSVASGNNNKRYHRLFNHSLVLPHVASPSIAQSKLPSAQPRRGYMFHGDMGRFDGGARSAMQEVASFLRQPYDSRSRSDLNRGVGRAKLPSFDADGLAVPSAGHAMEMAAAENTSRVMMSSSICFAPQGDIMTSRRLFDALASGCVPAVVKSIGNSPKEVLLGNLPFWHSVDWREIALFVAPRIVGRGAFLKSPTVVGCRTEEAGWLDALHDSGEHLERARRNARAAFEAAMDVEFNPSGVVTAILDELPHILSESGIMMPATYAHLPRTHAAS